jgi:hypothetical protein
LLAGEVQARGDWEVDCSHVLINREIPVDVCLYAGAVAGLVGWVND